MKKKDRHEEPRCKYCQGYGNLYDSNHTIGCNLEGTAQVLRWRGFEKEAEQLDNIAARLK